MPWMKSHVEEQRRRLIAQSLALANESTTQELCAAYEIRWKTGYKHQKKKVGGFCVRSRRIAVAAVYKRYGLARLVSEYFLSHRRPRATPDHSSPMSFLTSMTHPESSFSHGMTQGAERNSHGMTHP